MEFLIEQFLLTHYYCPIPHVGTLQVIMDPPKAHFGENKMLAPMPSIKLTDDIINEKAFVTYIETSLSIEKQAAANMLNDIGNDIMGVMESSNYPIGSLGVFYKNDRGKLSFLPSELPAYFSPSVQLNRVTHPNATHSVRVGDHEHSNQFMSALLSEKGKVLKDRWWVAASILFLLGLSGLIYSYSFSNNINKWSYQKPLSVKPEPKYYQTIP